MCDRGYATIAYPTPTWAPLPNPVFACYIYMCVYAVSLEPVTFQLLVKRASQYHLTGRSAPNQQPFDRHTATVDNIYIYI